MDAAAAASTKDILLLAQQKLDEINRESLGLSSAVLGRGGHRRKGVVTSHLLATMLYVSILSYKLENIKTMLEEEDAETYEEWRCLFETMHSPCFHAQERIIQNQRVKRTFSRKRRYKSKAQRLQEELSTASSELSKLQILSNETSNQMIKAINTLHEERASLVLAGGDKQRRIEELHEQYSDLRIENVQKDAMLESLESEMDNLRQILKERNSSIASLEEELSQHKHDAAVANEAASYSRSALDDARDQLKASNEKLADYQVATESTIAKLQHDLMGSQTSNTVLTAKLDAANNLLDATKLHFEENKAAIAEKSVTYNDIKNHLDNASDKVGSLELRMGQVHGAFSTEIQEGFAEIKEVFGGNFERENKNVLTELLAIRHQMKDLGRLSQLDSLRQEMAMFQHSLDCISKQHRRYETTIDDIQVGDLVDNIISHAMSRLGGVPK